MNKPVIVQEYEKLSKKYKIDKVYFYVRYQALDKPNFEVDLKKIETDDGLTQQLNQHLINKYIAYIPQWVQFYDGEEEVGYYSGSWVQNLNDLVKYFQQNLPQIEIKVFLTQWE